MWSADTDEGNDKGVLRHRSGGDISAQFAAVGTNTTEQGPLMTPVCVLRGVQLPRVDLFGRRAVLANQTSTGSPDQPLPFGVTAKSRTGIAPMGRVNSAMTHPNIHFRFWFERKIMEPTQWKIVADESGHEYLIEAEQEGEFRDWVAVTEEGEDYAGFDFERLRFNGPAAFYLPGDLRLVMNRSTGGFSFIPSHLAALIVSHDEV